MDMTSNANEIAQALQHIEKQIPFATSKALNETAKVMVSAENRKIAQVFSNPVPQTKKAVALVQRATKQRLEARVIVKDNIGKGNSPVQWLNAEVLGGRRRQKRSEKALMRTIGWPGVAIPAFDFPRGKSGNVTGSHYRRAVASLKAKDNKFFLNRVGHTPVIFERTKKADNGKARPFLILVSKAEYHRRFHFFKVGAKQFHRNINRLFDREFAKAIEGAHWQDIGSTFGPPQARLKFGDLKALR